jgi:DNA-directed RNA polymerase specialized sigma24 family protein
MVVLIAHLGAALEGLAPRDQRILELLEIGNCSRDLVAREMGVGPSGVKMILFRARKRLALAVGRSLGCEASVSSRPVRSVRAAG